MPRDEQGRERVVVDGLTVEADTINLDTADIEAKLGATNETAPATDTATAALNGRLQRVAQRLTSLIALLPASLGQKARTASLAATLSTEDQAILDSVKSSLDVMDDWDESDRAKIVLPAKVTVSTEFTRPTDTTAYAAKDVVGPAVTANLTFSACARANGGTGYVVGARLMTSKSTVTARHRLHLFHTAPTAIADNAPYTLLYTNRANRIGFIDFDPAFTEGSGSDAATARNIVDRLPFKCAGGSADLIGILETLDAYAAVDNAQTYFVELAIDRD